MQKLAWLLMLFLGAMAACGRTSGNDGVAAQHSVNSARSAAAAMSARIGGPAATHDTSPQPLSADDVQFYLTVMRAAAERMQHPTSEDLAAVASSKAATSSAQANQPAVDATAASIDKLAKLAQAAAARGDIAAAKAYGDQMRAAAGNPAMTHAPSAADLDAINRTMLLNGQADILIVRERHLDERRYQRVKDAIEEIMVPPALQADASCGGSDCGEAPHFTPEQIREQQQRADVSAIDRKTLEPHRGEITALESVVRRINAFPQT